jgi:hypothetical protein
MRCFKIDDPGTASEIKSVARHITVQLFVLLLRICEVFGFDSKAGRRSSQQLFRGRPHLNQENMVLGTSTLQHGTTAHFHVQIHHNRFTRQRKIQKVEKRRKINKLYRPGGNLWAYGMSVIFRQTTKKKAK